MPKAGSTPEIVTYSTSPMNPSGRLATNLVNLGIATFNGTISRFRPYVTLAELVPPLSSAQLILIQHTAGTGQIRLGISGSTLFSEPFTSYLPGRLVGAGGDNGPWVFNADQNMLPLPPPAYIEVGTQAGFGSQAVTANTIVGGKAGAACPVPSLPTNYSMMSFRVLVDHLGPDPVPTNQYVLAFNDQIAGPLSSAINHNMGVGVRINSGAALPRFFYNGLPTVIPGVLVPGAVYLYEVYVTPAATYVFQNGVLVLTYAVPPLFSFVNSINIAVQNSGVPDTRQVYFDDVKMIARTNLNGLLIPDGTGQELQATLQQFDLSQVALFVDPAAVADAQVEIWVSGA